MRPLSLKATSVAPISAMQSPSHGEDFVMVSHAPGYQQASLEELGALADPPMTKDAIAGRIRRLLALADKRAAELGIPDTEAALADADLGDD